MRGREVNWMTVYELYNRLSRRVYGIMEFHKGLFEEKKKIDTSKCFILFYEFWKFLKKQQLWNWNFDS